MVKRLLSVMLAMASLIQNMQAMDTADGIFDPSAKTLSITNPVNFMSAPIIRLDTSDRLRINFDIIGEDREYLRARLVHCNADWQPSRLLQSEFTDGFNECEIEDYGYSSNTFVHYVNYNLEIPNPELPITHSGNFLLQVFREDAPEECVLQLRFCVTENTVPVTASITSRTDFGFNTEWQQISAVIDTGGLDGANPYSDFILSVVQNNRPETERTVANPLRTEGSLAVFDRNPDLIFGGGNEYRRFETVRTDYPGLHVDSVKFGGTNWHAWLSTDESRAGREYSFDSTQHGRFKVDEYNATDPDLGADYVTVHFTFHAPELYGRPVYVDGDFTQHRFDSRNRMDFDASTGNYSLQIPLKQGSYNYQYATLSGNGKPDPSQIEGNNHETLNEYLVKAYYRPPGARADRLVGSALIIP